MVDTLGILNNLRLFKDVKDGGSHLAYEMMNHLNRFRNKNYYDETSGGCNKAMDKVIELYKENEHGTELVKDIERVLKLQTKEDDHSGLDIIVIIQGQDGKVAIGLVELGNLLFNKVLIFFNCKLNRVQTI